MTSGRAGSSNADAATPGEALGAWGTVGIAQCVAMWRAMSQFDLLAERDMLCRSALQRLCGVVTTATCLAIVT